MTYASIIVLTYNNLEYTRQCLESLYGKDAGMEFELIVVDNASSDGTPAYLQAFAAEHARCKIILNPQNTGFSAGNNTGAAAAGGEYIVFLNNDTVATPGWLAGLVRHLQDPAVGMVGPVTNASGNETRIRVDYADLSTMERFAEQYTAPRLGQAREIGVLPFLCVALRRAVWEQVGPLDERFGVGMFEDDDYALRLKQAGYRLLCAEDVFIHHWGSAGFSLAGFASYWRLFQKNLSQFENKWDVKWQPNRYRPELSDEQFRTMWEEKRAMAFEVIALRERLAEIEISAGWKILQGLRRARSWLAPNGSLRQRLLESLIRGLFAFVRWLRARRQAWLSGQTERSQRRRLGAELRQILDKHRSSPGVIIFAPSIMWRTPLFQRPQQLALAFARRDYLVFFCEYPLSPDFIGQLFSVNENLFVLGKAPLDIFRQVRAPIVFTLAYNREFLRHFCLPRVAYEYIDELDVLPGDAVRLQSDHDALVASAEVVIATADRLYERVRRTRTDAILCPNAVDDHFLRQKLAEAQQPPPELAPFVEARQPIIGYYGALAKWFDYSLLRYAAAQRPGYQFVLIGPDYDGSVKTLQGERPDNIHWLGPKPYSDLPGYLNYFSVAIIPFKLNEITHSTSPLKLFEYMLAGKPIVTTAMHECANYPEVLIAVDAADFPTRLDQAYALRADEAYIQALKDRAEQNTWDLRAQSILDAFARKK